MKKRILSLLLALVMMVSAIPLASAVPEDVPAADPMPYELWYRDPASDNYNGWENWSLPIGNSAIGGNVYGRYDKEHITLNEKSVWTGGPADGRNYRGGNLKDKGQDGKILRQVQQLFLKGDAASVEQAKRLCSSNLIGVDDDAGTNGYGTYSMFGDLYMEFGHTNVTKYRRGLDVMSGIATVGYNVGETRFEREYFTNNPTDENVMVIHLTAKGGSEKLNFDLSMIPSNDKVRGTGRTVTTTVTDNSIEVAGHLNDNQLKYNGKLQVKLNGEGTTAKKDEKKLTISNATDVTIVLSMATDYNDVYPDYRTKETDEALAARVSQSVEAAIAKSYDALKENHLKDYGGLMHRVDMDLGQTLPAMPTNELLNRYKNGNLSRGEATYLEVLLYQYGRYLLVSSSRGKTLPANLQGIWVGKNDSAWHSDYHLNVNLQMNYWPAYASNLAECALPLIDYVDALRAPGRVTAADYFGVVSNKENPENGFIAHTQNNPYGWTCPGWKFDWGWSPAGVPWVIQNVWEYYEFTQDRTVLEKQIYPIMKECTKFYQQILVDDGHGRLISCPAYSPEHGPRTATNTYEMSLVWQLFHDTIQAAELVGETDTALVNQWKDTFSKLRDPIEIGTDGQIKEWYEETTFGSCGGEVNNHRHISHLMGLFPGDLFTEEHPDWMEAARVSMNRRGFSCTGWGLAQRINTWARLHDGENAYTAAHTLVRDRLLPNLWDTHAPYQIDGNFGYTSGINEMLAQSHQGYLEVLPALPEAWKARGSVNGLLARGNIELGFDWVDGVPTEIRITAHEDGPVQLQMQEGLTYTVSDGIEAKPVEGKPGRIEFTPVKDQTCTIRVTTAVSVESKTGVTTMTKAGESIQLVAKVVTTEADKSVTWRLTYEDGTAVPAEVATISDSGLVTAADVSEARTLVATAVAAADPKCTASIRLQLAVPNPPEVPTHDNHFRHGNVALPEGVQTQNNNYGPVHVTDGKVKDGDHRLAMKDGHDASRGNVVLSVTVPQDCTIDEIVVYERIDHDYKDDSRIGGLNFFAPDAADKTAQVSYETEQTDNNIQKHVLKVQPITVQANQVVKVELVRNEVKPNAGITVWEVEAYGNPAARSENYFLNQTAALPEGYQTDVNYGPNWITDGKTPVTNPAAGTQDRMAMKGAEPSNGNVSITVPVNAAGMLDEVVVYERMDYSYGDHSRVERVEMDNVQNAAYTTAQINNNTQKHVLKFEPISVTAGQNVTVKLIRNNEKAGQGIGLWEMEAYGPVSTEPAEVNRADLLAVLNEAADFDKSKLDSDVAAFNRALADARRVANNPNATQAQINGAAEALRNAMKVDPDPIPGNDVNFYVYVNGEKKLAAHETNVNSYKFSDGSAMRQWFSAETLAEVYGAYGFTAEQMTPGSRCFGHEVRNGGSVWADRVAKSKGGKMYSPTLGDKTQHDIYYLPNQSVTSSATNTDANLIAKETLYTVTVKEAGKDDAVRYFPAGTEAVFTMEPAPAGQIWICTGKDGSEMTAVDNQFTISAIAQSYTVTLKEVPLTYVPVDEVPATCTENGMKSHFRGSDGKLYVEQDGQKVETTEEALTIKALGHDWQEPTYQWSADNSSCTASRSCRRDAAHVETAQAVVTSEETKQPTYDAEGEMTYTAAFQAAWAKTQTKTAVLSKLEPDRPHIPTEPVKPSKPEVKPEMTFADVSKNDWFYDSVQRAWEYGLLDGMSAAEFAPNGTLTVAETIKLAAALHQRDHVGDVTLDNGAEQWYSTYVDYAIANGIIAREYADDTAAQMNTPVSRSEFVKILHGAKEFYAEKNTVSDNAIPDVKMDAQNSEEIYDFYRAGILTGSDEKGTFYPGTNIKRSEAAAILVRMFQTADRQEITLQ